MAETRSLWNVTAALVGGFALSSLDPSLLGIQQVLTQYHQRSQAVLKDYRPACVSRHTAPASFFKKRITPDYPIWVSDFFLSLIVYFKNYLQLVFNVEHEVKL